MTEKSTSAKPTAPKTKPSEVSDVTSATPPDTSVDGAADGVDTNDTVGTDETPAMPAGTPDRPEGVDVELAPHPLYEELDIPALRKLAKDRGVEINRDVEKALLIKELRDNDRGDAERADTGTPESTDDQRYPSYDFMPLTELRDLAKSRKVGLRPEDEKGHLVGELRAADTSI